MFTLDYCLGSETCTGKQEQIVMSSIRCKRIGIPNKWKIEYVVQNSCAESVIRIVAISTTHFTLY